MESVAFTAAHRSVLVVPGGFDRVDLARKMETTWSSNGADPLQPPTKFRVEFLDTAAFELARTALLERVPKHKIVPAGSMNGLCVRRCPVLILLRHTQCQERERLTLRCAHGAAGPTEMTAWPMSRWIASQVRFARCGSGGGARRAPLTAGAPETHTFAGQKEAKPSVAQPAPAFIRASLASTGRLSVESRQIRAAAARDAAFSDEPLDARTAAPAPDAIIDPPVVPPPSARAEKGSKPAGPADDASGGSRRRKGGRPSDSEEAARPRRSPRIAAPIESPHIAAPIEVYSPTYAVPPLPAPTVRCRARYVRFGVTL
jgi:hypothetical protein